MCYGFSGSSSLKSKADALKYAIEFTGTGEYPNRVPDMAKAKELFDFICENVQLPDVETDQLSNSLNGFTSMMERLSEKKEEEDTVNEAVDTVGGIVEGEEPVDLRRSPLRSIYNDFVCKCVENGLINFQGSSTPGGMVESYTRKNGREYLKVTLEHVVVPLPEKE